MIIIWLMICVSQLTWASPPDCNTFYKQKIKPIEISYGKILVKYQKKGFNYLKLQELKSKKLIEFTLESYDYKKFMDKARIGLYVSKDKGSLEIRLVMLQFENNRVISESFKTYSLGCE